MPRRGDTEEIDELLNQGVDINHAGKHGITPLWWALVAYNYEGFAHLLEKGAEPNPKIRDGWGSVTATAARARQPLPEARTTQRR